MPSAADLSVPGEEDLHWPGHASHFAFVDTKAIEILVAAVRAGREAAVLEPPLPSAEIGE